MRQISCLLLIIVSSLVSVQVCSAEAASDVRKMVNRAVLSNDKVLFEQAVLMGSDGEWFNAEKIFRDVALRNPEWPEPKNNLAIALYNMGKLEQAQKALDEAVTSLPSFKVAQANRQLLYDYAATVAYYNVVGIPEKPDSPKLQLLTKIRPMVDSDLPLPSSRVQVNSDNYDGQLNEITQQIRESVLDWSKSWAVSDVDSYIAAYSSRFRPSDSAKSHQQWQTERSVKLRFGKIDNVSVNAIEVYLDSHQQQAVAQFVQHYQAKKYQDKVLKQLQLVLEDDRWLILSERVLQQLK